MRIDLHMHSNVSDGSLSPSALVELVHDNGVELMALTDHDTMDGVHQAARAAESFGIGFIPGVEVSTGWAGRVIHVVGLGMDSESAGVDAFFRDVCVKRDLRGRRIGERFDAIGIHGAYEGALSLADNKDNLSRTHFAHWLLQNGYVSNYQQAFDRYLKSGKPCCVAVEWPGLPEVVDLIHQAGGMAVIAHPGRYNFSEDWMLEALLKTFRDMGGEAIEVCSGSQSREADIKFADAARQMGFLASSGSDWHSVRGSRPLPGTQPQIPDDLTPVWRFLNWR